MKKISFLITVLIFLAACTSIDDLLKEKKFTQAEKFCEEEQGKEQLICYIKVADRYLEMKNYPKADHFYKKGYKNDQIKLNIHYERFAKIYLNNRKFDKAAKYYGKLKGDKKKSGLKSLANSLLKNNKPLKAAYYFSLIGDKKGLIYVGNHFFKLKSYHNAAKFYKEGDAAKSYYRKIAERYLKEKNYPLAAKLFEESDQPEKGKVCYLKAANYYLKKDLTKNILSKNLSILTLNSSNDGHFIVFGFKNEIFVKDQFKGKIVKKLLQTGDIVDSVISEDGTILAVATKSEIVVYNFINYKVLSKFDKKYGSISDIDISKDGNYLFSAEGDKVVLWDLSLKEDILFFNVGSPVIVVKSSPKGGYIATGDMNGDLKIWGTGSGNLIKNFQGHRKAILDLTFSKNGKYIVSGGYDDKFRVWDIFKKKRMKTITANQKGVRRVLITDDNKKIVTGGVDGTIYVWSTLTNQVTDNFKKHKKPISDIISLPTEEIISSSDDGTIFQWIPNRVELAEKYFKKGGIGKDGYIKIGEIYFEKEEFDKALTYYKKGGEYSYGLSLVGDHFFKLGDFDQAERYYQLDESGKLVLKYIDKLFEREIYERGINLLYQLKKYEKIGEFAEKMEKDKKYIPAVKYYLMVIKGYEEDSNSEKVEQYWVKVGDLFLNMDYKTPEEGEGFDFSTSDEEVENRKRLKNWMETKFLMAEKYYQKGNFDDGVKKIERYLCEKEMFKEAEPFYEKIDNRKVDDCYLDRALFHYNEAQNETLGKNERLKHIRYGVVYYNKGKDYRMLRKAKKLLKKVKRLR